MKVGNKEYIGDSVYVQYDGWGLILTTENGLDGDPSNTIFIEPGAWDALVNFVGRIKEAADER